jgi:hypothetical protein
VLHNGVKETLVEFRSKYWITKGRQFIRKIVDKCVTCRKYETKPLQAPQPPPLSEFRVKEQPPFTYIGLDLAGPLYIRSGVTSNEKTWICHEQFIWNSYLI